jgi:dethiobiotin synthetase
LGVDFDSRDLITNLAATPVIVAPSRLGVVNHVRLTLEALPKNLRSEARLVLMRTAKPDSAAASNLVLLGRLSGNKVVQLPWLGKKFSWDEALRDQRIRQTLTTAAA